MLRKIFFALQYWLFDPPWDTGVSPPELMDYIEEHEPGRALDLGCGTGTNAITLAQQGWEVVGVDFISRAIRAARRKARRAGVKDRITFRVGDVLELDPQWGPFDLILDIGCFHVFGGEDVRRYADLVHEMAKPGGTLLLYVHLKSDPTDGQGASEEDLQILKKKLKRVHRKDGMEGESRPSAWLTYRKPPEG